MGKVPRGGCLVPNGGCFAHIWARRLFCIQVIKPIYFYDMMYLKQKTFAYHEFYDHLIINHFRKFSSIGYQDRLDSKGGPPAPCYPDFDKK